jgi:MoaA/NifB/PqqE/SkfB family radical SAM enzyme
MHNSFYFHKDDNKVEELEETLEVMRQFMSALLVSKRSSVRMRVKDWFRAYLNNGLSLYLQGRSRKLPCGAGSDTFFLDPEGNILACNGSDEPWVMGNLRKAPFRDIWTSAEAEEVRDRVRRCAKNCWMTGTAVPAMRRRIWAPMFWVAQNRIRLALGKDICL